MISTRKLGRLDSCPTDTFQTVHELLSWYTQSTWTPYKASGGAITVHVHPAYEPWSRLSISSSVALQEGHPYRILDLPRLGPTILSICHPHQLAASKNLSWTPQLRHMIALWALFSGCGSLCTYCWGTGTLYGSGIAAKAEV